MKSIEIRLFFRYVSLAAEMEKSSTFLLPTNPQKNIFVGLLRSPENPSANYLEVADSWQRDLLGISIKDGQRWSKKWIKSMDEVKIEGWIDQ